MQDYLLQCNAEQTVYINSFVNMLNTVMSTKYHRIEVEFGPCTKRTVHVRCCMFWTVSICAPDWFIAMF